MFQSPRRLSIDRQMERGLNKNRQSRVCLFASLMASLWFVLFYLHFFVFGGGGNQSSYKISSNFVSSDTIDTSLVSFRTSSVESKLTDSPNGALPREYSNPSNAQLTPTDHQKNVVSTPDSNSTTGNDAHGNQNDEPNDASPTPKNPSSNVQSQTVSVNQSKTDTQVKKSDHFPFMKALRTIDDKSDPCGGRYIYVHDLPPRFNEDMLKECKSLSRWFDMCKLTTNAGLGPPLGNVEGVFSDEGWYATNQFAVDVIFNNRMKQYECLTNDSSLAAAIFIPFYAGFDVARYLWGYNTTIRDAASLELVDWLRKRPEWEVMDGKDHFLVAGRITWDFRRLSNASSDWGNKLLLLPATKNMSMLVVESSPWSTNDFAIPYPTYFHPKKDADVILWQDRMRKIERKWLFSFAGAPRPGESKSIRGKLIDQCRNSEKGKLLDCGFKGRRCHSPSNIMKMFQSSVFCLQPQGDSFTRRSAFDSMLAGCIPVFFHPGSAYTQYIWHLPKNYSKYSVFIPVDDIQKGNVSLEQRLNQISLDEVRIMREEVISLIPRLVYADPRSKLQTLKDAFDVSVQAIIDKVTGLRRDIVYGRTDDDFIENIRWKYDLVGKEKYMEPHEWDLFFVARQRRKR